MKYQYVLIVFLILSGCASSSKIKSPQVQPSTAGFEQQQVELLTETEDFGEQTIKVLQDQRVVEQMGDQLLKQFIPAYANQLQGLEYTEANEADVIFKVTKIVVNTSSFTLNFPHPGPIYKVTMFAEIHENDGEIQMVELQEKANMSEINYPNERFKRLTTEEKNELENQQKTLNEALRRLYQKLYFQYFDISLQL